MTNTYEVFYQTSCDEYGNEHNMSLYPVEGTSEKDASDKAQYELDKRYPDGKNEILKIKQIFQTK